MRTSVGILTVATNRYIDHWSKMVLSADRFLAPGYPLTSYVFTDQPDKAAEFASRLSRMTIYPVEIPNLGWPEATLLRYEIFAASWTVITEPLLIHLDADMLVCAETELSSTQSSSWPGGLAFVKHPGYRRRSVSSLPKLYARSPHHMVDDLKSYLRHGALGSWETSKSSMAYVPRSKRRTYVCGGTWMGQRGPLEQMIHTLAQRTRNDISQGVMAMWHDESHLNWYASENDYHLFDSDKCFAQGYPNLSDLTPQILAVDKGSERTR